MARTKQQLRSITLPIYDDTSAVSDDDLPAENNSNNGKPLHLLGEFAVKVLEASIVRKEEAKSLYIEHSKIHCDILFVLLPFLDASTLATLGSTCLFLYTVSSSNYLWKHHYKNRWNVKDSTEKWQSNYLRNDLVLNNEEFNQGWKRRFIYRSLLSPYCMNSDESCGEEGYGWDECVLFYVDRKTHTGENSWHNPVIFIGPSTIPIVLKIGQRKCPTNNVWFVKVMKVFVSYHLIRQIFRCVCCHIHLENGE